jgi:hypothetical protein
MSLKDALRVCVMADKVPYLEGPPGTGKSAIIKAVARDLEAEIWIVYLAQRAGNEIHGIPVVDQKPVEIAGRSFTLVRQAPPAWAVEAANHRGNALVFLDEVSNVAAGDAGQAMSILSERLVGEVDLPRENIAMVAAGNNVEMGAGAFRLPPPVVSRLVKFKVSIPTEAFAAADAFPSNWGVPLAPIKKFGTALDDALRWHHRRLLAAWVKANPDVFSPPKEAGVLADGFVCPRTVETAADLLAAADQFLPADRREAVETALLTGAMGVAGATGYVAFRETVADVRAEELLAAKHPKDLAHHTPPTPEKLFYMLLQIDGAVRARAAAQKDKPKEAVAAWVGAAAVCVWLMEHKAPLDLVAMLVGSLQTPELRPAKLSPPDWVAKLRPLRDVRVASGLDYTNLNMG